MGGGDAGMTPDERPKRLSLSQIVEMMLSRSGAGDRSSVTLTQNASGDTQIEVKVRTGDDDEIATADAASAKATALYDQLRERYPRNDAHDNAEAALTRNAKGETQITVAIKTAPHGFTSVEGATTELQQVYDQLRMQYPMADGYSAKLGSVK